MAERAEGGRRALPWRLAAGIGASRLAFDLAAGEKSFVLAFRWRGAPEHRRVNALAEGIAAGMADCIARETPLYLMLEGDVALTLGSIAGHAGLPAASAPLATLEGCPLGLGMVAGPGEDERLLALVAGVALGAALAAAMAGWAKRLIGGYTGDTLGAVQQKTETVFLVVAALFIPH